MSIDNRQLLRALCVSQDNSDSTYQSEQILSHTYRPGQDLCRKCTARLSLCVKSLRYP